MCFCGGAGAWGQTPLWWKQSFLSSQNSNLHSNLIHLQWLEDPLWVSLLSSNRNAFWACKVAQLSWTAESMLFIKKPLTAKTKGINIVTHISYTAENFKAHLNKTGHKRATPPLMGLGGDSHLLGKWNKWNKRFVVLTRKVVKHARLKTGLT